MAITFTLCVLGGVIAPGLPIPHRTLELLLPGFTWISPGAFALGLVETCLYGVYAGWLVVLLHNFFARYWTGPREVLPTTKAASVRGRGNHLEECTMSLQRVSISPGIAAV